MVSIPYQSCNHYLVPESFLHPEISNTEIERQECVLFPQKKNDKALCQLSLHINTVQFITQRSNGDDVYLSLTCRSWACCSLTAPL